MAGWLILALFLIRLAVPLFITIALALVLRWLDAKWEAEAQARLQNQAEAATREPPQPQRPEPPQPTVPVAAWNAFGVPCRTIRQCSQAMRRSCPMGEDVGIPCWLARRRVEGRIPADCYHCLVFAMRAAAYHDRLATTERPKSSVIS